MDVRLGIFAVPNATARPSIVETVIAADRAGVKIVGIQDHPYQRRYHDTWTLMWRGAIPTRSCAPRT